MKSKRATKVRERPFSPYLAQPAKMCRAIESDQFPFEFISELAEAESWRKEVYRPIYHVHKWWAQRLGSVFRAIILGSLQTADVSVAETFHQRIDLDGKVVFDPFMGSGTTVGEAHKLGCSALGRDINPVAFESVRVALGPLSRSALLNCFADLREGVGSEILSLYRSTDQTGQPCDVLYYFWVKTLPCPGCSREVPLFSTCIFAKHAYAAREPGVHVVCPQCEEVFAASYHDKSVVCPACKAKFDPHTGPAQKASAVCQHCRRTFPIARTARQAGKPPSHRLYAKLILRHNGEKRYLQTTPGDRRMYEDASKRLEEEQLVIPDLCIAPGYNTNQVLNYGYTGWRQFFNSRQLLALGLLARAIRQIPDADVRGGMAMLFSSTLEFNNIFASYKGEGTGAVRHMFAHHILKPERMPIEANVWGTPRSSGAFSTLFKSRLLRAIDYREAPFEVTLKSPSNKRVTRAYGCSPPFKGAVSLEWPPVKFSKETVFLSCGSSASTGLRDRSVDCVITDPPFFDNVHYSELADFFYAWQSQLGLFEREDAPVTTRHLEEVQDIDANNFADKLAAVWKECYRVLKDDALLVFTYHHSRDEGWSALAQATLSAGFAFVQAHPVKSEMSVAAPKSQAKEPIDLDIIFVCRKATARGLTRLSPLEALRDATEAAREKMDRFRSRARQLSRNDVLVVLMSQLLIRLSGGRSPAEVVDDLRDLSGKAHAAFESLYQAHTTAILGQLVVKPTEWKAPQLSLHFAD